MDSPKVLEINNLTKVFGEKTVLKDVNLSLKPSEVYGFLGPNGAGKTTTIRTILGYIKPTVGSINIFGEEIKSAYPKFRNNVGFLSADGVLYDRWNSLEHIEFVSRARGKGHKNALTLASDLGLDTKAKVGSLSSGNKQKLAVVLAFMHDPKLLILDEPTRGLDPLLQELLYGMLKEFRAAGGTVFMSSHNLSEVEKVCDHIGIIRGGILVADETLDSIRKMKTHNVFIDFVDVPKHGEFALAGVHLKEVHGTKVDLDVQGDLNPLLQKIAKYKIRDLSVRHANLEDIFMRFYNEDN